MMPSSLRHHAIIFAADAVIAARLMLVAPAMAIDAFSMRQRRYAMLICRAAYMLFCCLPARAR